MASTAYLHVPAKTLRKECKNHANYEDIPPRGRAEPGRDEPRRRWVYRPAPGSRRMVEGADFLNGSAILWSVFHSPGDILLIPALGGRTGLNGHKPPPRLKRDPPSALVRENGSGG